uniref:Uncharacterized protein n=1 Tax=Medicago truncatula TaxID=3880 RepID=I3S6S5_MEDTR|nr:unknown [Medicago truncatula]
MSRSSQTMFGILRRFTFDPGISDQITEISEIGIRNHLHKKTNSTSKHHLFKRTFEKSFLAAALVNILKPHCVSRIPGPAANRTTRWNPFIKKLRYHFLVAKAFSSR